MRLDWFVASESGAVAVEWVVMTAAVTGLTMAALGVVAGGVEDLSGEVQADLVVMNPEDSPFEDAETAAAPLDFSGHSLVGPQHSEAWRSSEQQRFASMSDADLMASYESSRAIAQGGVWPHAQHETDRMGVMLGEMSNRGLDIPADGPSYEELHASMGGVSA